MPRLLPLVLSRTDLPEAELAAARLDGELVAIGDCFGSVDEFVTTGHRGASLAAVLPSRLIAERMTAAWVLGAVREQPAPHQLCADTAARYRSLGQPNLVVREVVMDDAEVSIHGAMRVTTPLRTAIDLVRIAPAASGPDLRVVRRLARLGGFGLDDALDELDRRRHLPNKSRAAGRMREAFGN